MFSRVFVLNVVTSVRVASWGCQEEERSVSVLLKADGVLHVWSILELLQLYVLILGHAGSHGHWQSQEC